MNETFYLFLELIQIWKVFRVKAEHSVEIEKIYFRD